ncbi:MAG TPA: methyltransferase [Steroidobacteraceae bacterium]|nr:methyltransferase [Steroidobacteraceae bacterium]
MSSLSPDRILQVGMGFWSSKTLLSAVELGVFTELGKGPCSGEQLRTALGLSPRAVPDFFDALVALGFLERHGDDRQALYANTPESARFLDRSSPAYVGGMLEMSNARLYGFWGNLTEALRTGQPQNEIKDSGEPMFKRLYEEPARLEQFLDAMAGISAANFQAFAKKFDFSKRRTLADVGGATGQLARIVATRHPHMRCTTLDLPAVTVIAERKIEADGLEARVQAKPLDFQTDAFPSADIITMGMILHDWNLENKRMLIRKAYDALPEGGCFVVIENLIDDARRTNAFGLLMSLNMLIEFGDAFDYTGADFDRWCREAGFKRTEVLPLAGPASAAIAYK